MGLLAVASFLGLVFLAKLNQNEYFQEQNLSLTSAEPIQTETVTPTPTNTATPSPKPSLTPSRTNTRTSTQTSQPSQTPTKATETPQLELASPTLPKELGCPTGCEYEKPGCHIKGNISSKSGEKIYHMPYQRYYAQTVINPEYGERWFCTEEEAIANGWRKSKQ